MKSKSKKQYKHLLKLMYKKGLLADAQIDIEDYGWDMDHPSKELAVYSYHRDCWGGDYNEQLITNNLQFALLTKDEYNIWYNNDHEWNSFPKRLSGLKTPLDFIMLISKMPNVKLNKKYNPKRLMKVEGLKWM